MSTVRLAVFWGLAEAVGRVAVLWVTRTALRDSVRPGSFVLMLVYAVALGLMSGVTGALILRIARKPVAGWGWATWGGAVAASLLMAGAFEGLLRNVVVPGGWPTVPGWVSFALMIFGSASRGLVVGAAEGLALWGRAWPPAWRVWMASRVGLSVLAGMVSYGIPWLIPDHPGAGLYAKASQWAAYGFVEAAGRAWLLDRCVFKREAEAAPAA